MKIDGNIAASKQVGGVQRDEKGKSPESSQNTSNTPAATKDIVSIALPDELPKEMISRENALEALSKSLQEMKSMPEDDLLSVHKPIDSEKVEALTHN